MALTFSEAADALRPFHVVGDLKLKFVRVTFDNSYPTGGEAISPSDFGMSRIVFVSPGAISDVATKHVRWVEAAGAHKLQIMVEDGTSGISAEAANASDQSAVDVNVMVFGY